MIADTFIRRPVTAIVVSLVLAIIGTICIINLPVSQYPNITPPVVQVAGQYTGADATTVEQTVATPIEEQVNGTHGMEYMQSNSTNNGLMTINTTFKIGTDIDVATLDVQNRVSIASPFGTRCGEPFGLNRQGGESKRFNAYRTLFTKRLSQHHFSG